LNSLTDLNPDEREGQIIHLVLSGDTDKFRILVEQYQSNVFNLISRLLKDRERAMDISQEAFVNAYKALKSYDPKRPFAPWLLKIAKNCALGELRKQGKSNENQAQMIAEKKRELKEPNRDKASPEGIVLKKLEMTMIESALSQLGIKYRSVVILRHQEQMKQSEIAETLSIPIGTVKSRLNQAYKILRTYLITSGVEQR